MRQSKNLVKNIVFALAAALGLAIYLFADSPSDGDAEAARGPAVKRVAVAPVAPARDERELRFSGVTRSARRARLGFALGGRLVARPVEVGDQVRAGQELARLDDLELRHAAASARAAVAELAARRAQSERDRDRAEQLQAVKAATREELERTTAAVDAVIAAEAAAAARLAEAERLLAETRLTAPFAGTVTEVLYEPGEVATAGRPVVVLSGDGEVEVEVEVPESVIPRLRTGDLVEIALPVLGLPAVEGRIKSVGRTAAGPGRLFPVIATLPSGEQLAAGVTAELVLRLTADDSLAVPVEAVVNPGGRQPAVFRLEPEPTDGRRVVRRVPVEVRSLLGDQVSVQGDLAAGDLVVVGGQRGLLDGEAVEVER